MVFTFIILKLFHIREKVELHPVQPVLLYLPGLLKHNI